MTSPCQKVINNNKIKNIKRKIHQTLIKKYEHLSLRYNSNIIDNIIYNERTHTVALFKDRLILDDNGEFLKRYYLIKESFIRLPKFFEYYALYSKIFPNYTSIPEGKYFYQNIQKKQKMIDIQEKIELEKHKQKLIENHNTQLNINDDNELLNINNKNHKNNVFSTDIINSILNETNKEDIELLFNVNKDELSKEENIFSHKINDIVTVINKYENNKNKNNKKSYNKDNKNKKKESISKNKNKDNKSHSGKKNKINNIVLGNDINNNKFVKLNFFNKSTIRKNTIFYLINEKKINNSINLKNNISKIKKNDKNYIKIIEQKIFKKKQLISKHHSKNIFHNISNSESVKKELSKSKRNSSNNSKKPSESTSSFNLLCINSSLRHKIKNFNKINLNSNINHKNLGKKKKKSIRSPHPLTSKRVDKNVLNISLDKKKINKCQNIKTKYTYSSNNIYNNKKHKKSLSNGKNSKGKKPNIFKNFRNNNINNLFIQKKTNNINNSIKNINKRKIIKSNIANNYFFNKKSKYKNNTYYLIDSRNNILNDFLNSCNHRKTNITKKNSINSLSSSRYNVSKSKSKSNKKNNSKNNLFDSNNSNLFIQKVKPKNVNSKNIKEIKNNKKNIINKYYWKNDSRNKKVSFNNKNISKYNTKNILQNETSLKISFIDGIKYNKKNYSKIFNYINHKHCCSKIQNNYSFNNLY